MKKIICSLFVVSSVMSFAQSSILNASSPQTFREEREVKKDSITPLKYGFIEDKDILRSMVVWEIIDMNDIKKPNDWFVAQLENPSFTMDNFRDVGLTADNTGLLDKNTYRNSKFVQEMFSYTHCRVLLA